MSDLGPIGRLGRYTATHVRVVMVAWLLVADTLGIFAPRVEHALSGAGWEATGSESVQARQLIDRNFGGLSSSALQVVVHSDTETVRDPAFQQAIVTAQGTLQRDPHVSRVVAPLPGRSISRDGHTAVIQAGAAASANEMVRAADDLKAELEGLNGVQVSLTGASGMWSDFNEANRSAMLRSEVISWPVTMIILVLAFGSLVAAGLPLMLTIIGLITSAGSLFVATQLLDVSIWAMNFALMFALALGIDYALFIVMRFRAAFFESELSPTDAVAETMDTAGKAVLFSGVTVLISLTAVMLVPSPAFRSMALGIMLAVLFILAATLTLLPAVLAKLGPRIDKGSLPWVHSGEHRRASPHGASASGSAPSRSARSRSSRCSRPRSRCWGCRPGCRRSRSSPTVTARAPATPRSSRPSAAARPAHCKSSRRRQSHSAWRSASPSACSEAAGPCSPSPCSSTSWAKTSRPRPPSPSWS